MSLRYVTVEKFAEESGYTADAIRNKVAKGVWLENRQFRRAPDGRVLIDVQGVAEALENERATCGVYLLCAEGAPVYVGRSTSLNSRLRAHQQSGRQFDEVRIIPCDEVTSIWLERELIRTLQPVQNLVRYLRHTRAIAARLS